MANKANDLVDVLLEIFANNHIDPSKDWLNLPVKELNRQLEDFKQRHTQSCISEKDRRRKAIIIHGLYINAPAISAALKPLGRLIAQSGEELQFAKEAYLADKIVFDPKKEAIESRVKLAAKKNGDVDRAIRELHSYQQTAPKEPIERRYKSNDTTIEKLGEILRDNPAGILILRDEVVGLIAS
jgi:hypothetical protein